MNHTDTVDTRGRRERAARTYARPSWVKSGEEKLCPDYFKVVGERRCYQLACLLGKRSAGMTVSG